MQYNKCIVEKLDVLKVFPLALTGAKDLMLDEKEQFKILHASSCIET